MIHLLLNEEFVTASIGEAVAEARNRMRWSIKDTAAHLNIGQRRYRRIEKGQEMPDTLTLANLVHVLGVDANRALGDQDELIQRVYQASVSERQRIAQLLNPPESGDEEMDT